MKNRYLWIAPIATLLFGFIPSLILSIHYKVFFLSSSYNIPLCINASVMLGDSILLPIINYYIIRALIKYKNQFWLDLRWDGVLLFLSSMLFIGAILSIAIHLYWVGDDVTDFVGLKKGVISVPGITHLIFTSLQLTIAISFSAMVIKAYIAKYLNILRLSLIPMRLFVGFTFLSIIDMINKKLFVYKTTPFKDILIHDSYTFGTISFSIILLIIVSVRAKSKND